MAASDLDALAANVAVQADLDRKAATMLLGLAELPKATSNDQNVQKLAREFRAAVPKLIEVFVVKSA